MTVPGRHVFGLLPVTLVGVVGVGGCTHTVKVEPIKVEPIDITLHIYLEADQKLDAFFEDVDETPAAPVDGQNDGAQR